jgi:hypothetical protein
VPLYQRLLRKTVLAVTPSFGTQCGIASYTYDLFQDVPRVGFARAFDDIFALYDVLGFDVIHFQHEHGLYYNNSDFILNIKNLRASFPSVRIFVTLHTVYDYFVPFYANLSKLATIVVLNPASRLHIPNAQRIEHGVPEPLRLPVRPAPSAMRRGVIATFGFFTKLKRLDQVCDIARRAGVLVDVFTSATKVQRYDCDGRVYVHQEFLSTPDLVNHLARYDVLFFLRRNVTDVIGTPPPTPPLSSCAHAPEAYPAASAWRCWRTCPSSARTRCGFGT